MPDGMTAAWAKSAFYRAMSLPMRVNGAVYRRFRQPRTPIKVQLGPGQRNYVPGWVNVDGNFVSARIDLWANLLHPLPFRDDSVETFYSFHVVEHLPDHFLPQHFSDMFRALAPGGGIRIGGPDIGNACRKYIEGDASWFSDYPDRRRSVGGRLANFALCHGEHLSLLSESYLTELAHDAGFIEIRRCLPCRETSIVGPEILAIEHESDFDTPHSVIIEGRKPR
jgi:predicted SAM-dependent methyltransferase